MKDEELESIYAKLHDSRKYDRTMADWARKYGLILWTSVKMLRDELEIALRQNENLKAGDMK